MRVVQGIVCFAGLAIVDAGSSAEVAWPTLNPAFEEGRPYQEYVQPTVSGLVESGMFGCVRNNQRQFHEGLDLKPVARDRRGEAADAVFAIGNGIVRHASAVAGLSSYGRYVIIEHSGESPAIISLYAHLLSISPQIAPGRDVSVGQTLGIMGRSAAGYTIPKDRAHLHVETGLWLSERFQEWYGTKGFGSKNEHGNFNGMNVVAFDLLDFLERKRAGQVRSVRDYLVRLPTAMTVVVRSRYEPDFVRRYPGLVAREARPGEGEAWQIDFTWFGLPKAWQRVPAGALSGSAANRYSIVFHDQELLDRYPCQGIVRLNAGRAVLGPKAQDILDILFDGG